jgi:RNA polymerase sigma-70 factor (ECF subfamily)
MSDWVEESLRAWRETRRPEALGELLKAQRNRAYTVALRLTGSPAEAEDAVQDACVKLLSRTKGFEDRKSFEVAVYRAVVQCSLDRVRAGRRAAAREAAVRNEGALLAAVESAAMDVAEQREVLAELRQAVAELPEEERVPIVLCYGQGLSVAQAAETLEVPRETLRARLSKTLEGLRLRLKQKGRSASRAVILLLLWQDGSQAAPASLCEALDKVLPGRACADVPALAQAGPAATAASAAAWTWAAVVAGCAVVAWGAYCVQSQGPRPQTKPVASAAQVAEQPRAPEAEAPANPAENPEKPSPGAALEVWLQARPEGPMVKHYRVDGESTVLEEEAQMNAKWMAPVLAGGVLLSGAALATDPNPEVAKVIAQIEARRAEKAEAQAKLQPQVRTQEGGQSSWSVAPGARTVIRSGQGQSATVIIQQGGDKE